MAAAALAGGPRWQAEPTTLPATRPAVSIQQAIRNLAANDFEERERASRQLFRFGLGAEPALRKVLEETDIPEVRNRVQRILNHFAHGVFADTPDAVVVEADRYADASESDKRAIIRELTKFGGYGYIVLIRLADEEKEPDLKDFIERQIVSESRQVAETAAERLLANDEEAAERILAMAARSGEEPTARAYAALLLDTGRLEAAIDAQRGHMAKAEGAEKKRAARCLAYLLRAAGRLDEALEAAKVSEDVATLRTLALDRHDWGELAKIVVATLPDPSATQQSAGEVGIVATARRWGGDAEGFKEAMDRLAAVARSNEAATTSVVGAMLLNGQIMPAAELLTSRQKFAMAYELLLFTGRFDEALAVVDRAKAEGHADALPLTAASARIYWRLGQRQKAQDAIDQVAKELKSAQTYDLAAYVALCDVEREIGRCEPSHAAKPREFAIAAINGAPPNTPFDGLFEKLFPEDGALALQWWEVLRQLRANESVESRFDVVESIMNRTFSAGDFDAIARGAVNGAWLGRLNDNTAREKVLLVVSQTLQRAGRADAAESYLDMLATQREARQDWMDVGLRYAEKKEYRTAADYFDKAGSGADAYWLRGWAMGKAGDAAAQKHWCELAIRRTLGDDRQMALLALAMESHDDAAGAIEQWRRILRVGSPRSPLYFEACRRIGNDASAHDDPGTAAASWQMESLEPLELDRKWNTLEYLTLPELADRTRLRAEYRQGPAGLARAVAGFQPHLAIQPTYLMLPLQCVPELRRMAREKPADGQPYEAAARQLFDVVAAKLNAILQRYPESAFYHNEMAWLCVKCGYEPDQALAHAQRAVQLLPREVNSIDTLAEVFYRRGDKAKAVELMKTCETLEPNQPQHRERREAMEAGKL